MPFSSYSDLKNAIGGFLARTTGLEAKIADAIALFEAEYNGGEDNYFAEDVYTINTTAGTALAALPTNFNEPVSLSIPGGGEVKLVSLPILNGGDPQIRSRPTRAALYPGNRLKLSPTPDTAYAIELIYEANLASLTDAAPSNWMLQKYPNVYLYGSLKYMLDYLQDGVRADTVKSQYAIFLSDIQGKKASKKLGSNPVMQQPKGCV